jgi:hypothetical protein
VERFSADDLLEKYKGLFSRAASKEVLVRDIIQNIASLEDRVSANVLVEAEKYRKNRDNSHSKRSPQAFRYFHFGLMIRWNFGDGKEISPKAVNQSLPLSKKEILYYAQYGNFSPKQPVKIS